MMADLINELKQNIDGKLYPEAALFLSLIAKAGDTIGELVLVRKETIIAIQDVYSEIQKVLTQKEKK